MQQINRAVNLLTIHCFLIHNGFRRIKKDDRGQKKHRERGEVLFSSVRQAVRE